MPAKNFLKKKNAYNQIVVENIPKHEKKTCTPKTLKNQCMVEISLRTGSLNLNI
jgi:hypothetical protein